ncbi:MAG: SGNH/GDSL hydrolase family protein [Alphaproteobacteria bacterium]|nr:SGNH/GDSL hydrolase family protein [Alphaproteobacteria bacterium]
MSKLKSVLLSIGLIAFAVVFSVFFVELSTRFLDAMDPLPARSWQEHRERIPPPYQGVTYDVHQLVAEAEQVRWKTGSNFGWLPEDREGHLINIKNNRRVTPEQPAHPAHRIWMFGGSTMINVEVPDAFTLPSLVQKLLNKENYSGYAVENMGATTITSRHELYKLQHDALIEKGDIVIFYDGVNDVIQSLYYKNPHGTMIEGNRRILENLPPRQKFIWWIYSKLGGWSAFVKRFVNPTSPDYIELQITDKQTQQLQEDYFNVIKEAASFAQMRGATFFHFLQPTIYSVSRNTPYEQQVIANGWLYPSNFKDVYARGYPALQRASRKAAAAGISAADLTAAFDNRDSEIFLDSFHVNERGNEIAAQAIYAVIQKALK